MSNKNFFFVDFLDIDNGWGNHTLNYLKNFKVDNVVIFCKKKNNNLPYKQIEILPHPLEIMKNPLKAYYISKKIEKILNENYSKFHLISHFTIEPYALLLAFSNIFQKNLIYIIGTYSIILSKFYKTKYIYKKIFKKIDYILFLSRYTQHKFNKLKYPTKGAKKDIIHPIIPLPKKKISNRKFKNKTLLSVGMIKPRKGHINLIEAMNVLINYMKKKIHLVIIGKRSDENYYSLLKNLIKKYKLQSSVTIKTNVNQTQLNYFYKNSHLFILLSEDQDDHFEGFGIVYLEALSFGQPLIVSSKSGARDLKLLSKHISVVDPKKNKLVANYIISNLFSNKFSPIFYYKLLQKHVNLNKSKLKKFLKKL